jgi:acyl-CoA reductase-like NAD-dependent aldehyde dehydrogenase
MANSTGYGLAAGIWTSDIGRSLRFAEELEAGTVWVNSYLRGEIAAPFGGVKNSGFGRELGLLGPLEFCQVKTVYIKDPRAVSTKESVSA